MKTYADWLREWLHTGKRALPLLQDWLDALVARDAARIDALNARLTPLLERLEQARGAVMHAPERETLPTDLLQQAMATAQAIDAVAQTAYDIIRNELDYTHGMMAILTRAAEPDHYAPTVAAPSRSNVLLNTEA
ncbi:MAG: hypothetical protein WHS44_01275 [Fimbriimonadales bacterium]|nr:MAG: hypothetical protein KatS3mg018_0692 [Fimbriimonadales bacterium]